MCCGRKASKNTGRSNFTPAKSNFTPSSPAIKYYGKVTNEGKLEGVHGSVFLATKDLQQVIGCEIVVDGKLTHNVLFVEKYIIVKRKDQ